MAACPAAGHLPSGQAPPDPRPPPATIPRSAAVTSATPACPPPPHATAAGAPAWPPWAAAPAGDLFPLRQQQGPGCPTRRRALHPAGLQHKRAHRRPPFAKPPSDQSQRLTPPPPLPYLVLLDHRQPPRAHDHLQPPDPSEVVHSPMETAALSAAVAAPPATNRPAGVQPEAASGDGPGERSRQLLNADGVRLATGLEHDADPA